MVPCTSVGPTEDPVQDMADNTNVALCNIQALQMRVINGRCIPVEPPQEKLPNKTPYLRLLKVFRHHL
jgi:hypothetical protein